MALKMLFPRMEGATSTSHPQKTYLHGLWKEGCFAWFDPVAVSRWDRKILHLERDGGVLVLALHRGALTLVSMN